MDVETTRSTGAAYEVSTAVFEGPFDLLLHLILAEKVDLYEVSLARIVDAYLVEIDRMDALDLEVATGFLLVAATLVELKSKRLLPDDDDVDLDDELALWEERDLLLARLLECKTFKDAAAVLEELALQAQRSHPRRAGLPDHLLALTPDPLADIGPLDVREAFLRATAPRPTPKVSTEHLAPIRVSVAEAIIEVADEIHRIGRLSFRELTSGLVDRLEIVVRFLAVLELYKQGHIELGQAANFGEIDLAWIADDTTDRAQLTLVDAYDG